MLAIQSDERLDGHVMQLLRICRPRVEVRSLEYIASGDFCRAFLLNGHEIVRVPHHAEARRALVRETCVLPLADLESSAP